MEWTQDALVKPGWFATHHNMPCKANCAHIEIETDQGQQHRSPFRLYRIFGATRIRAETRMHSCLSKVLVFLLPACALYSCVDSPDFPVEPQIEFISISKDTIRQGIFQEDSLYVTFSFTDGDGDLGRTDQEPDNNVFFIDERTGALDNTFAIPNIPPEGAGNGVEGEVRILLFSTCCIYSDGTDPCQVNPNVALDTVQYRIYIRDRAGHASNEILTAPIILRCQ
jgi:hypothetical protein